MDLSLAPVRSVGRHLERPHSRGHHATSQILDACFTKAFMDLGMGLYMADDWKSWQSSNPQLCDHLRHARGPPVGEQNAQARASSRKGKDTGAMTFSSCKF